MTPEGQKAFGFRTEKKSRVYSHENEATSLAPTYERLFKMNKLAWDYFEVQAPSYRKVMTHWIMNAKQEKTRLLRLEKTIKVSAQQKRMD